MERLYRDFTVCKKCGGTCYLGNDFCEDCANKLFEEKLDLVEELKNKILELSKLETKLAESENRFQAHKQIDARTIQEQTDLIEELKQQLAEKDADLHQIYSHLGVEAFGEDIHEQALKEIRRLLEEIAKKDKQLRTKIGNMKSTDFIMMCLECGFWIDAKEKDNQDKISFAVEQLEKVKEEAKHYGYEFSKSMHEYIDNQIKQLKEGSSDEQRI